MLSDEWPDDIAETARGIYAKWQGSDQRSERLIRYIAAALLAERDKTLTHAADLQTAYDQGFSDGQGLASPHLPVLAVGNALEPKGRPAP